MSVTMMIDSSVKRTVHALNLHVIERCNKPSPGLLFNSSDNTNIFHIQIILKVWQNKDLLRLRHL